MLWGIAIAVFALALIATGLYKGRRGTVPHCYRCAFSLAGLPGAIVCPECGSDLKAKNAVSIGRPFKRRWVAIVGLLVLTADAGWQGYAAYRSLRLPGWEARAPGWWLAEVEVRWSVGTRLDTACSEVFRRSKVNPASIHRASAVAYARLAALPDEQVPVTNWHLLALASQSASTDAHDRTELVRLIRAGVVFMGDIPVISGSVPMPPTPMPNFLPAGWVLSYSGDVLRPDGSSTGSHGEGELYGAGKVLSSWQHWSTAPATGTVRWEFSLKREGEHDGARHVWRTDRPWTQAAPQQSPVVPAIP